MGVIHPLGFHEALSMGGHLVELACPTVVAPLSQPTATPQSQLQNREFLGILIDMLYVKKFFIVEAETGLPPLLRLFK